MVDAALGTPEPEAFHLLGKCSLRPAVRQGQASDESSEGGLEANNPIYKLERPDEVSRK